MVVPLSPVPGLLASSSSLPTKTAVDTSLIVGATVFGVGWGLGGFCPGPAVVSAVTGATPVVAFVVAMLVGMASFDAVEKRASVKVLEAEDSSRH